MTDGLAQVRAVHRAEEILIVTCDVCDIDYKNGRAPHKHFRLTRQADRARRVMKLAMISPAAERQERRERLRRDRAAALALREVYPAVLQLRLDLLFHGSALNKAPY